MRAVSSTTSMLLLAASGAIGCAGSSAAPAGEGAGTSEDAISMAQCRQSGQRSHPGCIVTGVVEGGFRGEVDPTFGEACVLFVRETGSKKVWGLVEDFYRCDATAAYDQHVGELVTFHKGDLSSIARRSARDALRGLHASASFQTLDGAVSPGVVPANAFRLACKPVGDACKEEADLGYCIDSIDVAQIASDRASLVFRTSKPTSAGRIARAVELSVSLADVGPVPAAGALPERIDLQLDEGRWIALTLEAKAGHLEGTFDYEPTVGIGDEFESLPVACSNAQ